jgi:hypothetical protein
MLTSLTLLTLLTLLTSPAYRFTALPAHRLTGPIAGLTGFHTHFAFPAAEFRRHPARL